MKKLAPIVLFTYNRLNETIRTVEALQQNYLASDSELYIFSDGAKENNGRNKIQEVRDYLHTIKGFENIYIKESIKNKGLANSIIEGVTEVMDKHEKVIVLEDDLITSPNFLNFMNQALDFYIDSPKVMSISGYSMNLPSLNNYCQDFYIGHRASSLGWGTWKEKWINIDWNVSDYSSFRYDFRQQFEFFKIGSDMPGMLKSQIKGKIDSWAIRWCYHQFKYNLITVFATISKVNHIGISEEATNAAGAIKFHTPLDTGKNTNFLFQVDLKENKQITKEFKAKFSISRRVIDKLIKKLNPNNH
ncbi:Glycosyl transferase family 2 [Arenibacter palladensis]|uniref:Glycosyl transferase family 2 n=1 Tax=Arenibacter palladensis TaxID=237373 RepID=A0A1M5G4Q3_9FLAO|nr:glycosyltransferase [Arenibacter palladensis]SHF98698.1 Glycosyl transferase family 2 [Arenibacter palladensis]